MGHKHMISDYLDFPYIIDIPSKTPDKGTPRAPNRPSDNETIKRIITSSLNSFKNGAKNQTVQGKGGSILVDNRIFGGVLDQANDELGHLLAHDIYPDRTV